MTETDCVLSVRYEEIRLRADPVTPKIEESLEKRILWSIVSKAADRSKRARAESLLLSIASKRSF